MRRLRRCCRLLSGHAATQTATAVRVNLTAAILGLGLGLAAVGKGKTGVAVDVGASDGVSGWLLLAHGHYVHLFEPSINRESRRIMSNLELNGWEAPVSLHGTVVVRPPGERLDRNLAHEAHIGVLKIDVDGNELTVIESAKGLLPPTSIVQVSKQTNAFT